MFTINRTLGPSTTEQKRRIQYPLDWGHSGVQCHVDAKEQVKAHNHPLVEVRHGNNGYYLPTRNADRMQSAVASSWHGAFGTKAGSFIRLAGGELLVAEGEGGS